MMSRWLLVALLAFALAITASTGVVGAQTAPGAEQVPAPPSNLQFFGGTLHWMDNAHNEEGYRITVETRGDLTDEVTALRFEAGPDEESFPLPVEAQGACPDRTSVDYAVVAFNEAGESQPARTLIRALCPALTPLPTSTPDVSLPPTGSGPAGNGLAWPITVLAAAGLAALGAAGALRLRRR